MAEKASSILLVLRHCTASFWCFVKTWVPPCFFLFPMFSCSMLREISFSTSWQADLFPPWQACCHTAYFPMFEPEFMPLSILGEIWRGRAIRLPNLSLQSVPADFWGSAFFRDFPIRFLLWKMTLFFPLFPKKWEG